MRVRLWGVRGSVPWASATCIGHGCNTPCVEVLAADGRRLILDAGSGLVGLDEVLLRDGKQAPILLTHYHWDHLQGLPFFTPLYVPGATPTIFFLRRTAGFRLATATEARRRRRCPWPSGAGAGKMLFWPLLPSFR